MLAKPKKKQNLFEFLIRLKSRFDLFYRHHRTTEMPGTQSARFLVDQWFDQRFPSEKVFIVKRRFNAQRRRETHLIEERRTENCLSLGKGSLCFTSDDQSCASTVKSDRHMAKTALVTKPRPTSNLSSIVSRSKSNFNDKNRSREKLSIETKSFVEHFVEFSSSLGRRFSPRSIVVRKGKIVVPSEWTRNNPKKFLSAKINFSTKPKFSLLGLRSFRRKTKTMNSNRSQWREKASAHLNWTEGTRHGQQSSNRRRCDAHRNVRQFNEKFLFFFTHFHDQVEFRWFEDLKSICFFAETRKLRSSILLDISLWIRCFVELSVRPSSSCRSSTDWCLRSWSNPNRVETFSNGEKTEIFYDENRFEHLLFYEVMDAPVRVAP